VYEKQAFSTVFQLEHKTKSLECSDWNTQAFRPKKKPPVRNWRLETGY